MSKKLRCKDSWLRGDLLITDCLGSFGTRAHSSGVTVHFGYQKCVKSALKCVANHLNTYVFITKQIPYCQAMRQNIILCKIIQHWCVIILQTHCLQIRPQTVLFQFIFQYIEIYWYSGIGILPFNGILFNLLSAAIVLRNNELMHIGCTVYVTGRCRCMLYVYGSRRRIRRDYESHWFAKLISTWTEWPPFRILRQYFQMPFRECEVLYFD